MPVITSKSAHSAVLKKSNSLKRSSSVVSQNTRVSQTMRVSQNTRVSHHREFLREVKTPKTERTRRGSTAWQESVEPKLPPPNQNRVPPPAPVEDPHSLVLTETSRPTQSAPQTIDVPSSRLTGLNGWMLHCLQSLADSPVTQPQWDEHLNKVVGVVVVLNTFMMGLELDLAPQGGPVSSRLFWFISESAFIAFFVCEVFVRIYFEKARWLISWWNWLDLIVISIAVAETWVLAFISDTNGSLGMLTLLRIVRLARLIRVVRLVRVFRNIYITVMAFKEAVMSIANIGMIMLAGIFVCAIFTTSTIGRSPTLSALDMGGVSGADRFGSIPFSMFSLFELMTLEGWEQVGRPLVAAEPFMAFFLLGFIMVFTFGILNMVVAMVVEKTIQQSRSFEDSEKNAEIEALDKDLDELKLIFDESDVDGDGMLSRDEFETLLTETHFLSLLQKMNVDVNAVKWMYSTLDVEGADTLAGNVFVEGLRRLRDDGHKEVEYMAMLAMLRNLTVKVDGLDSLFHRRSTTCENEHASVQSPSPKRLASPSVRGPTSNLLLESSPAVLETGDEDLPCKRVQGFRSLSQLSRHVEEVREEILERVERQASEYADFAKKATKQLDFLCDRFASYAG